MGPEMELCKVWNIQATTSYRLGAWYANYQQKISLDNNSNKDHNKNIYHKTYVMAAIGLCKSPRVRSRRWKTLLRDPKDHARRLRIPQGAVEMFKVWPDYTNLSYSQSLAWIFLF